jgi:endonuclease-3
MNTHKVRHPSRGAADITTLLLREYPDPRLALEHSSPLELIVATILSAQCTDARVNAVTATLFRKYRRAADYARAQPATFEQEIKSTGFYRNKARLVIDCCRKLVADYGGEVPHTLEELLTLPGVGRKTANIVLGSAFGQQAIAVDTHVLRVSNRLGLVRGKNPDKVEQELMARVPSGRWTPFTLAMILHGRQVCTARNPRCPDCVLYDACAWPDKGPRTARTH